MSKVRVYSTSDTDSSMLYLLWSCDIEPVTIQGRIEMMYDALQSQCAITYFQLILPSHLYNTYHVIMVEITYLIMSVLYRFCASTWSGLHFGQ